MNDPVTAPQSPVQTGTFGAPDMTRTRRMQRQGGNVSLGARGGYKLIKTAPRVKSGNRKYK